MKKNHINGLPYGNLNNWRLKMRLTILLFIVSFFQISANSYSQNTKVSLDLESVPLVTVLKTIESQSEFKFLCNTNDLNIERIVSIKADRERINRILDKLFANTPTIYRVIDKQIILKNDTEKAQLFTGLSTRTVNEDQENTITGTVVDSDGIPILGVNIIKVGTTVGTQTDFEGNFSIPAEKGEVLQFSYIGMETKTVTIGDEAVLSITLNENAAALDEIVVVGYGTQKKSNVSGSIVSVNAEAIGRVQSPSFDSALQGQVPGVYVTSNGGQPGGGISVRIRGAGTINDSNPLYIIDGIAVPAGGSNNDNNNPLATINPNDIATIDILKDAASTAIYGARAANGVVLITTKRGQTGKPTINFNAYAGIQKSIGNIPDPLNATQYAENINRAFTAAGDPAPFDNPSSLGTGTNWIDEVVGTGWITEQQLAISGGNENHKYYVSINNFENQGIMLETFQKRISMRVNTDNQITKGIKIGNSIAFTRGSRFANATGARRDFIDGDFTNLYTQLPTIPVFDSTTSTGYGGPSDTRLERRRNNVSAVSLPERDNITYRFLGNVYAEIKLLKGLTFKSSGSVDIGNNRQSTYTPIWEEQLLNSEGFSNVAQSRNNSLFWSWENTLTYANSINQHNFTLTAGTSAQESTFKGLQSSARYTTDVFREIDNGAAGDELTSSSFSVEESLASVFGRLTYDFDNKYLLTAAVRRDGSSKFGPGKKFGVFPSFTAGWRISQENFFTPEFISSLKVRGGWGQVGSDGIGNFRYLASLDSGLNYAFGNENGNSTLGAALINLANANIQWETATEYNFGVDAAFMNNKLTFSAEYYNRTRSDILLDIALPDITGLNQITENIGEVVNKGLEFALGYGKRDGDFTYDVNFNLSTLDSEVVDLGGREEIVPYSYSGSGATVVIRPGQPLGVFLGRRHDGIFQTQAEVDAANAIDGDASTPYQNAGTAPGDFRWKDLNGDGVVNNDDKEIIGSPIPDFTYGFGANFGYKNFDMSMQFYGVQGNDIFNIARSQLEASGRTFNKSSAVLEAWNGSGTSNTIPRPIVTDPNQNIILSDLHVEDGSYLRLKNLQFGYTIPSTTLSHIGVSNARIYLAGQNVFVLTKFTGIDPEVGFDRNRSAVAGIYNDLYPQVQTWSLGLNIGF